MEVAVQIVQIVIGLGILNVWLVRFGKQIPFRGGDAKNMKEEFQVYGLPDWFLMVVGFFKIVFAAMLIVGAWVPYLTLPAAIGMSALMLGAVSMHVKVKDPVKKAVPAFCLLILCLIVAVASWQLLA